MDRWLRMGRLMLPDFHRIAMIRDRLAEPLRYPLMAPIGHGVLYSFFLISTAFIYWNQYGQFYPAMVAFSNSKPAAFMCSAQAGIFVYFAVKLLVKVLFGTLSALERQELHDTAWFETMGCFFILSSLRGNISYWLVMKLAVLVVNKGLSGLVNMRVDVYSVTLNVSWTRHVKHIVILLAVLLSSLAMIKDSRDAAAESLQAGRLHAYEIVIATEYLLVFFSAMYISFKYAVYRYSLEDVPNWPRRDEVLKWAELVNYSVRFLSCIVMFFLLALYDIIPLYLLRTFYQTTKDFIDSFRSWRRARTVLRSLESHFSDISPLQLAAMEDRTCAICRDDMTAETRQKRLQCGHSFHLQCIQDWLRRQNRCPTCRAQVQADTPPPVRVPLQPDDLQGVVPALGRLPLELQNPLVRLLRLVNRLAEGVNQQADQPAAAAPNRVNEAEDGGQRVAARVRIEIVEEPTPPPQQPTPLMPPAALIPPALSRLLPLLDETTSLAELMELYTECARGIALRYETVRTMAEGLQRAQQYLAEEIDNCDTLSIELLRRISRSDPDLAIPLQLHRRFLDINRSVRAIRLQTGRIRIEVPPPAAQEDDRQLEQVIEVAEEEEEEEG